MKNHMASIVMPTILGAVALGLIGGGIPYGIYSLVQNKNNKVNDEPFKEDRISSPIHKEIPKQPLVTPQLNPNQKDDNKPTLQNEDKDDKDHITSQIHEDIPKQPLVTSQPISNQKDEKKPTLQNEDKDDKDHITSPIHKEISKQPLVTPQLNPNQKDDNKPNLPGVGSAKSTICRTWKPTSDPFKLNIHEDVEQCTLGLQKGSTCWLMSGACAINSFLDEKDRMKSQDDALVNFYKAQAMEEAIGKAEKTNDNSDIEGINPLHSAENSGKAGRFANILYGLDHFWKCCYAEDADGELKNKIAREKVLGEVKKHFSDGNVTPVIVGWWGHYISFLKYDDNNGFTIYNSLKNELEIGTKCNSLPEMDVYNIAITCKYQPEEEDGWCKDGETKSATYKVSWKDGNKNREEICEGLFALRQCLKEDVKIKVYSVKVLRDDGKPDHELVSDSNLKIERIEKIESN